MRAFDIVLTAIALRASPTRPQRAERRLAPAVDDPGAAVLDRNAIDQERAVLIASLWPPARQCVVEPVYAELPAPVLFGAVYCVSWGAPPTADARALQARLRAAFAANS